MQSAYLIPAEAIAEPEPPPGFPEDPQAARTRAQLTTARATGRAGRGVAQGTLNGLYRIADNSDVTPQALTARSTPAREWIQPLLRRGTAGSHARVGTPTRSRAADCRSPPGVRQGASTGPAGVRSKQPRCGGHRFRRDAAVRARPRPVAALSPIERRAGRRRSAAGGELSWSGIRGSGRRWAALALISVVIARQLSRDCTCHTRGPRSIAMSCPAANNQLTWRGSSQSATSDGPVEREPDVGGVRHPSVDARLLRWRRLRRVSRDDRSPQRGIGKPISATRHLAFG